MSDDAAATGPAAPLLWEVGCEELPAWACDALARQLPRLVSDQLVAARLVAADVEQASVEVFVGPRRFAIRAADVLDTQRAQREESRGPAVRVAFAGGDPSGEPSAACIGFARGKGMIPDQLEVRTEGDTQFVYAVRELPTASLADVWPQIARDVLEQLQFAKPMRWGTSPQRFVRPVRWMLTLHGTDALSYDVWDVTSGDVTRTHRFLGDRREAALTDAATYERDMRALHVVVDQAQRRESIEQGLATAARDENGEWSDPGGVLGEVVHLVEQPTVITGHFDTRYLELPERVLITAMQSHQRYFPVRKQGGLAPAFLTVMNADPRAIDTILPGYERVLAGRLDDAVFSFERDRTRGLDDMASDASLSAVVFHARAGSLAERRDRIELVAAAISADLGVDDATRAQVADAARLAKADQVSTVVQEFAELEGFAGSLYAQAADYHPAVADAIDQQFLPRSATGQLPDAGAPSILALADKLELLVTMFSIGEAPTGSRDPHALRRAAIGVMRIIFEHDLPLMLDPVLNVARVALASQQIEVVDGADDVVAQVREFILDRVEKSLVDDGVRVDAVRAARAAGLPRLQHVDGLARAIDAAVRSDDADFQSVLGAVKRCEKILAQADAEHAPANVDESLFEVASETALDTRLDEIAGPIADNVDERRFSEALQMAAELAPQVDAFFDRDRGVMIMADDARLRDNRLALCAKVVYVMRPLGDLTALQI